MKQRDRRMARGLLAGLVFFGCTCQAAGQQIDICDAMPAECEEERRLEAIEWEISDLIEQWRNTRFQTTPENPPPIGCDNPPFRQPGTSADDYLEKLKAWMAECEKNVEEAASAGADTGAAGGTVTEPESESAEPEGETTEPEAESTEPGSADEYAPIVKVDPVYPARALSRGMEGYVDLAFTVTATGTVKDPIVVESSNTVFDRAAMRAVLQYRYKPRVVDGVAVETPDVKARVVFELERIM
jgi:TonB family protein